MAAVTRGKRKCAVPELPAAANPTADPSSVLRSDPGTVLPQNPNLTTEQQSLTDFQLQVQQGYEQDTDWLDRLFPADQAKCCEKQGFWWYGDALVVPDSQTLRKQCLHKLHNCPYSGHLGVPKTQKAMERLYWWKGMCEDMRQHIRNCSECQKNKTNSNQKPGGLLQPLQIPGRRWESISVDLITQLPMTQAGNTRIVVFIDRFSKMVHVAAVPTDFSAYDMARRYLRTIIRAQGVQREIVSDRDTLFTSAFWEELTASLGSLLARSTVLTIQPQMDRQKRTNRTLEEMLRHFVSPAQDDWDKHLDAAEFAINNAWQESVQNTAFMRNTGQRPLTPASADIDHKVPAAKDFSEDLQEAARMAKQAWTSAQQRQAQNANQKRCDVPYKVGDSLLLSTKNIRLKIPGAKKLLP